MRNKTLDTLDLKAFVTVAECGSFSEASQRLYVTQPAVSKRIAALEQSLNHSLFDRLGRKIHLTEAGEHLLPKAKKLLTELAETERSIKELSGEMAGTLIVATSHHVGLHHLPPILREFSAQHANVNLQFEFLDSEKSHEKVLNGHCELAIVTLPSLVDKPLARRVLWKDPLVFVSGPNHALSKRINLTLRDLAGHSAILPDLNTFTGRMAKQCFDDAKLSLKLNMTTNYLETIKMMVSVGLGWSLLPKTLVDQQLCILDVKNSALERELGIIYHEKRSFSNAASAFYQMLCLTADDSLINM